MRVLSLPGPRDLVALGEQALALVPRVTGLLGAAESLVVDARALLDRIEDTRARADAVVGRTEATRARADRVVRETEAPVRRLVALLDELEPPLLQLRPTLERLAATTSPREVDALVGLVDQLPRLSTDVEQRVLPVLRTFSSVAPDLHDLLEISRELNELLAHLPGMGRVRKRVEEDQRSEAS